MYGSLAQSERSMIQYNLAVNGVVVSLSPTHSILAG
jgi:hypothetical protein